MTNEATFKLISLLFCTYLIVFVSQFIFTDRLNCWNREDEDVYVRLALL